MLNDFPTEKLLTIKSNCRISREHKNELCENVKFCTSHGNTEETMLFRFYVKKLCKLEGDNKAYLPKQTSSITHSIAPIQFDSL